MSDGYIREILFDPDKWLMSEDTVASFPKPGRMYVEESEKLKVALNLLDRGLVKPLRRPQLKPIMASRWSMARLGWKRIVCLMMVKQFLDGSLT